MQNYIHTSDGIFGGRKLIEGIALVAGIALVEGIAEANFVSFVDLFTSVFIIDIDGTKPSQSVRSTFR